MKKLTLIFATLSLVVLTSRCTFADDIDKLTELATDSLSLVLGTPVFDTGFQLEVKNAKSKDYIEDAEVSVSITGKNAGLVYNNLGIKSSVYKSKLGMLNFILDPTKIDTTAMKSTPLEFDLQISAPGYLPVTQRVQFQRKELRIISVNLVKLNDAPAGIAVSSAAAFASSNASGATTSTASVSMNGGGQVLTIEPGVVMRDAAGAAVSGTVAATIVYYDPASADAQQAFPGGYTAAAKVEGNAAEQYQFTPAGLFNIKLSAGGKTVKTFSNGGMSIKTELPEGFINPETNQPVKENDQIDMWSRDEGTGEWTFEKKATVKKVNGKLIVEEQVTHLSEHMYSFATKLCPAQSAIHFTGSNLTPSATYLVTATLVHPLYTKSDIIKLSADSEGKLSFRHPVVQLPGYSYNLVLSAANESATGNFTLSQTSLTVAAGCSTTSYNVTLTENTAPQLSKININLYLSISSGPLVVKPNLSILYRVNGSGSGYESALLRNGTGKMGVLLNTNYDLLVSLGGNQGKGNMKIESISTTRYRITFSGISLGNGSTNEPVVLETEKALDGSINVTYKIEVDSDVLNQLL